MSIQPMSSEELQALGALITGMVDDMPSATSAEIDDAFRTKYEQFANDRWDKRVDADTLWLESQIRRAMEKRVPTAAATAPVVAPATPVSFKEIALPLAARGIPIVRLQPKSKVPMDKAWQEIATTDVNKILAWHSETPEPVQPV